MNIYEIFLRSFDTHTHTHPYRSRITQSYIYLRLILVQQDLRSSVADRTGK